MGGRWCGRVGGLAGSASSTRPASRLRSARTCAAGSALASAIAPTSALSSYSTLFLLLAGLLVVDRLAHVTAAEDADAALTLSHLAVELLPRPVTGDVRRLGAQLKISSRFPRL